MLALCLRQELGDAAQSHCVCAPLHRTLRGRRGDSPVPAYTRGSFSLSLSHRTLRVTHLAAQSLHGTPHRLLLLRAPRYRYRRRANVDVLIRCRHIAITTPTRMVPSRLHSSTSGVGAGPGVDGPGFHLSTISLRCSDEAPFCVGLTRALFVGYVGQLAGWDWPV